MEENLNRDALKNPGQGEEKMPNTLTSDFLVKALKGLGRGIKITWIGALDSIWLRDYDAVPKTGMLSEGYFFGFIYFLEPITFLVR